MFNLPNSLHTNQEYFIFFQYLYKYFNSCFKVLGYTFEYSFQFNFFLSPVKVFLMPQITFKLYFKIQTVKMKQG